MKLKFTLLFMLTAFFCFFNLNAQEFYCVESPDGLENLTTVDISTGVTTYSVTVTMSGYTIDGFVGMTRDMSTGTYYVLVKDENSDRHLASLDPSTGVATSIGILSFNSASSLTSDNNGTLYAITGGGGSTSDVYEIDPSDATSSLLYSFADPGGDGEAIGYNETDGLIYRYSGASNGLWETVDPDDLTFNSITSLSGIETWGFSLYYDVTNTQFIFTGGNTFYTLQTDGTLVELSTSPDIDDIKGIVAVPVTYSVTCNVDMTDSIASGYFLEGTDQLFLGTDINEWATPGSDAAMELFEGGTNDFYTLTLDLEDGDYMYKYFKIVGATPSWDNGEWNGDPNRDFTVAGADVVLDDIFGQQPIAIYTLTLEDIKVYPNPSNGVFNVNVESNFNLEIFDISGRLINTQVLTGNQTVEIDAAGIYFFRFSNEQGSVTQRVVVN